MTSDAKAIRCDAFLGGKLNIWQPVSGYRAGIDPVMLAASVLAEPGQELLDLGCGVGVAALCAARRVDGLRITGLELQTPYADLARRNGQENGINFEVLEGDLARLPAPLKDRQFHHVIANPPYFDRGHSKPAERADREIALGEKTALSTWIKVAAQRARPKGYVTFILRTERLVEFLTHAKNYLGSLEVLPLKPYVGEDPRLLIVKGRRAGRAAFRLLDGWVLHERQINQTRAKNYTNATNLVLREGMGLDKFS
ncbi:MAG: methyltransferase [Pseudomonadota bacterium]